MPRYRTEFGVVVNIPAEKTALINGLVPVEPAPPSPARRRRKPKSVPPTTE